ncbi:hypothetical protein SEVIR_9G276350v4 [Setaria viridis]|uniref:Secreted protein n=1 Tax=Setaria viridis TaxID=4556 RepID=A0A4U6T164_SETVI|nr:hypothetical protein SEVIR_9G276350v2 [Setaria viridis]
MSLNGGRRRWLSVIFLCIIPVVISFRCHAILPCVSTCLYIKRQMSSNVKDLHDVLEYFDGSKQILFYFYLAYADLICIEEATK